MNVNSATRSWGSASAVTVRSGDPSRLNALGSRSCLERGHLSVGRGESFVGASLGARERWRREAVGGERRGRERV